MIEAPRPAGQALGLQFRSVFSRKFIMQVKQALNRVNAIRTGLVTATLLPVLAHAAADTTAIEAAKTDGLAVAASILGVMVALWGARLVYRKFFGG